MSRDSDGFDVYLEEISHIPILSAKEELELARRAREGDETALEKLIIHNTRFVVFAAKKYRASKVPFPDLVQAGNLGLIIAAQLFDPSRGVKFISFAVYRIREQILLCMAQQRSTIRIPIGARNLLVEIERYRESFNVQSGRLPSDDEVAKNFHVKVEMVRQLQVSDSPASLDVSIRRDSKDEMYELIPDDTARNPEELYLWREEREELLRRRQLVLDILKSLPVRKVNHEMHKRNIQMFIEHYGLDGRGVYPTLKEIGDVHGITREAVRQAIDRVFQRVQARIGLAEGKRIPAGNKSRTVWRGSAGTGLLG